MTGNTFDKWWESPKLRMSPEDKSIALKAIDDFCDRYLVPALQARLKEPE